MEYKSIKGISGLGQIGLLFALLALGLVSAGAVQYLFSLQIANAGVSLQNSEALQKAMLLPQNVGLARASQVVSTCMLLFVPAVLYSLISHGKNWIWLGFSRHFTMVQIAIGFALILLASMAAVPVADFSKYIISFFPSVNSLAKSMETAYMAQALALSNLHSMSEYVVALFIMAFFPALFEEVFFRGALQTILEKWWQKPLIAIMVTSLIFSLIHSSIYLFLSRALLGFVLGYMFYLTKNIWVNIIAHFINNAIVLTALYVNKIKTGKVSLDTADPSVHWAVGLCSTIVLIGCFILLHKFSKNTKQQILLKQNLLYNQANQPNPLADL